jgi:hypothetical protein
MATKPKKKKKMKKYRRARLWSRRRLLIREAP